MTVADLHAPAADARRAAVNRLAQRGDASACCLLGERLAVEHDPLVRDALVLALRRTNAPSAVQAVIPLLRHETAHVRNAAVLVLQGTAKLAAPALADTYAMGDPDVRKLVLDAAARFPAELAAPLVSKALADEDENVVMAAVELVGRLRLERHAPALVEIALHAVHPMLEFACLDALRGIAGLADVIRLRARFAPTASAGALHAAMWFALVGAAGDGDDLAALAFVARTVPAHQRPALLDGMAALARRHPAHEATIRARQVAVAFAGAECDHDTRRSAARFLREHVRDPEILGVIIGLLADRDATIRLTAADALGASDEPAAREAAEARLSLETDRDVHGLLRDAMRPRRTPRPSAK